MGLDFDQLFPNRFLKAGQFQGRDVTLTVKSVKLEELEGDKGKEMKAIIAFAETPKQLVLNKTNGLCLKGMFGRSTDAWVGKRVTFWPAPNDFGESDIAIRVRGSPDLAANMQVEIKLARKKPRQVTMMKTGGNQKKGAPPQQKAQPSVPVTNFDKPVDTGPVFGGAAEAPPPEEPPPFGDEPDSLPA